MTEVIVDRVDALPPGSRRRVVAAGRAVAVFNVGGAYFAVADRCPHQGAPLSQGLVTCDVESSGPGDYRRAETTPVVRCPWHGWEFDLRTGKSRCDPDRIRARPFQTKVIRTDTPLDTPLEATTYQTAVREGWLVVIAQ